jgi:competence protein ComEA
MLKKVLAGALVCTLTSLSAMSISQVNSANKEKLMEINGVGAKKAALILSEKKHGKFKSFDDLTTRVKGIGKRIALNIKKDIKKASKKKLTKKLKENKKKVDKK